MHDTSLCRHSTDILPGNLSCIVHWKDIGVSSDHVVTDFANTTILTEVPSVLHNWVLVEKRHNHIRLHPSNDKSATHKKPVIVTVLSYLTLTTHYITAYKINITVFHGRILAQKTVNNNNYCYDLSLLLILMRHLIAPKFIL